MSRVTTGTSSAIAVAAIHNAEESAILGSFIAALDGRDEPFTGIRCSVSRKVMRSVAR